jgi:hypothetical protein
MARRPKISCSSTGLQFEWSKRLHKILVQSDVRSASSYLKNAD